MESDKKDTKLDMNRKLGEEKLSKVEIANDRLVIARLAGRNNS